MKFPSMVYRCPGRYDAGHNKTYDYKGVNSQKELDKAIAEGWDTDLNKAKEIYTGVNKPTQKSEYRLKLEEMAKNLGVKFAHNTKDETLYGKVKEASKKAK